VCILQAITESQSHLVHDSGQPIFLLDTHTEVVVYYAPSAQEQPFPPPQGSLLRNAINAARAGRRMTPRLRLLRSGASPDHDRRVCCLADVEPLGGPTLPRCCCSTSITLSI
jgi:hypothetical protein